MTEYTLTSVLLILVFVAMAIVFYSLRARKTFALGVSLFVGVGIGTLYYQFGGYNDQMTSLANQKHMEEVKAVLSTMRSSEELIDKLKAKISEDADNPKGWYLLGRLEASLGHWKRSYHAFKEAYKRNPNDAAIVINCAQSYMMLHQNRLNAQMRGRLQAILKTNPAEANVLSMLAIDAYQKRQYDQAITYWQALLKLIPAGSEDAKAVTEAIAKANKKLTS